MKRRGELTIAVAITALIGPVLSGCAGGACSGAAVPVGPVLAFSASGWFAAHPQSNISVCFDRTCRTFAARIPAGPRSWPVTITGRTAPTGEQERYAVTVDIHLSSKQESRVCGTVTASESERHVRTACGPGPAIWTARASLDGHGALVSGSLRSSSVSLV